MYERHENINFKPPLRFSKADLKQKSEADSIKNVILMLLKLQRD